MYGSMASLMQKKMSKTQDHRPHHHHHGNERYHEGERAHYVGQNLKRRKLEIAFHKGTRKRGQWCTFCLLVH